MAGQGLQTVTPAPRPAEEWRGSILADAAEGPHPGQEDLPKAALFALGPHQGKFVPTGREQQPEPRHREAARKDTRPQPV